MKITSTEATDSAHEDLREAITALTHDDAELIRLVYWDGLTSQDAALIIGINPSTARSRLARLKTALRTAIETQPTRVGEHNA